MSDLVDGYSLGLNVSLGMLDDGRGRRLGCVMQMECPVRICVPKDFVESGYVVSNNDKHVVVATKSGRKTVRESVSTLGLGLAFVMLGCSSALVLFVCSCQCHMGDRIFRQFRLHQEGNSLAYKPPQPKCKRHGESLNHSVCRS